MELVGLKPTDRILDLGCGRGRKSVAYYNRLNPIVGVDRLDPRVLDQLGDNFTFVSGEVADLSRFADGSFDVVVSFGLLEHLSDDEVRAIAAATPRLADRFAHVVPTHWPSSSRTCGCRSSAAGRQHCAPATCGSCRDTSRPTTGTGLSGARSPTGEHCSAIQD